MTKRLTPQLTAAALAVALLSVAGAANATPGYVSSPSDTIVTNPYGLCWKTSSWTPSQAVAPCDAVASASVPAPAPVVSAPPPAPAPAPQAQLAPPAPAPVIEKVTLESDVLFEFDKAELRPSGQQKLDELASRIKDARVESISAVGHADRIGPDQYNEKLSAARAESVKQYLAQKGIEEQRVQSQGRGEAQPVTGDQCKGITGPKLIACLQPDRRVEIEVRGSREVAAGEATTGSAGATGGASGSSGASGSTGGSSGSSTK